MFIFIFIIIIIIIFFFSILKFVITELPPPPQHFWRLPEMQGWEGEGFLWPVNSLLLLLT